MMIKSKFYENFEIPSAEIITSSSITRKSLSLSNVEFIPLVDNWKDTIDNKEIIFMPAAIDLHVHFREPGFEHKETIKTGSLAALYGGCTTVLDMPNTNPTTTTLSEFKAKKLLIEGEFCNVLIAAGISNSNSQEIPKLAKVTDFWKVYLDNSFNAVPCSKETFIESCKILSDIKCKAPIFIHAMNTTTGKQTIDEENQGIEIALEIANMFEQLHFNITHVSNDIGLEKILKKNLSNVTLDTSPRYFMPKIEKEELLRCNPPIRTSEIQEKLRDYVKNGKIYMLATDHAPHILEEKLKGTPGAPGVQELYPLMIDWMLRENGIDKKLIVKLLYENPKKLIKNKVLKNNDFILIDKDDQTIINNNWIKSKCGWSLYENQQLRGKIIGIVRKK